MTSSPFSVPIGLPPNLDVVRPLRRTGERAVWELFDREKGERRALKLVHAGASDVTRHGIAEEFLLLQRIRHRQWVRPFDFFHLPDGSCGYLMEYLEGDEPRDIHSPGWLPRDVEGVRAVLGALATLHAIGYVHLDLKPSQILCVPGRGAVLIDPGLAAKVGSVVEPRGTWGFIAPEVLTGSTWDRRADLYALGSMLLLIWTGESVLGDGEIAEQVRRQMKRPKLRLRDRIEELPDGMDYIIESLLDPDPGRRPPDAAQTWHAFHTIAGYRESYLEHERVPPPTEIPFFAPAGVDADWDLSLAGTGPDRWVIEGPIGSGRRRLLGWLHARSQVSGAVGALELDRFDAAASGGRGFSCRIGRAGAGERVVSLGAVGNEAAAAALESYGLVAEGGEGDWSRDLLRLRLEERLGGEIERHRCARERRTMAAGMTCDLTPVETKRLARLLAAVDESEIPSNTEEDAGLLSRGLVSIGPDGKLVSASPPWDTDSLRIIAGDEELAVAHRGLLSERPTDALPAARHALALRDPEPLRAAIAGAVQASRARGDVIGAHDLLVEAGEVLGPAFTKESLPQRLALVLESGVAPGLSLLTRRRDDLPPGWRALLDGQLALRVRKYEEAVAIARHQAETAEDPALRLAAMTMLIRGLQEDGRVEEALALGLPFVRAADSVNTPERLPIAIALLQAYARSQGPVEVVDELRARVEASLPSADLRGVETAAGILGLVAFRRGDWPRATHFFQMQVGAAEKLREPSSLAIAKMSLAGISFVEGRIAECEALNREALLLSQQFGNLGYATTILMNIGTVLDGTGRLEEALGAFRHSRILSETEGNRRHTSNSLAHELTTLASAGLLQAGRQVFQELMAASRPLGSSVLMAGVRFDMAQIARCEGKLDEARTLLHESRDLARECEATDEIARTSFALSLLELAMDSRNLSEEYMHEGETAYQSSPSSEIAPLRDFTWAAYYGVRNDPDRAFEHLGAARELVRESGRLPWLWKCHAAEAMLAARLGGSDSAFESLAAARLSLYELLEAIHNDALKESYILLPDPRVFLAWCENEPLAETVPLGSSDLVPFSR